MKLELPTDFESKECRYKITPKDEFSDIISSYKTTFQVLCSTEINIVNEPFPTILPTILPTMKLELPTNFLPEKCCYKITPEGNDTSRIVALTRKVDRFKKLWKNILKK